MLLQHLLHCEKDPDPRKTPQEQALHVYLYPYVQVAEQSQVEDPLAMSIAGLLMSRPGSVMDGDR